MIAKVVTVSLFASFIVSFLYIGSWLFLCIASYIAIALTIIVIAIVIALLRLKGEREKSL